MANVVPIPRSRGSLCGVALVLLGGWAGLAPFVGPYLGFGFTPDSAWQMTDGRLYMSALPGGIALACGLLIIATRSRGVGALCAFGAALAGGWLIAGTAIVATLPASVRTDLAIGRPLTISSVPVTVLTDLAFFSGTGALILFFAALAIGRLSIVAHKDALRFGTDLTPASGFAAGGPLAFDPFAAGAGAGIGGGSAASVGSPFTPTQPQFYPAQQYPSQYPPDPPGSSATISTTFPPDPGASQP
jgi:hypothetical protein